MRVLIYSDIHANLEALAAMEAATRGRFDASLCLGDVVGYGANPNETTAWVRAHAPTVIRGNHDRACSTFDGIDKFNQVAAAAARWTNSVLDPDHLAWLTQLPAGPYDWEGMSLVHGSPLDEDEYLVEPVQAAASFVSTTAALQWFGHTHLQGGFVLAGEEIAPLPTAAARAPGPNAPAEMVAFPIEPGARYLINPGSIGQPRDADWRAGFAIYDADAQRVELHRIPYDIAGAQARILAAGLPQRLAARLALGR